MIKLTAPNGKIRYFAVEHIICISPGVDETFVWLAHTEKSFTVRENPEQVARMIVETKRRKMELQSAYTDYFRGHSTVELNKTISRLEKEDTP